MHTVVKNCYLPQTTLEGTILKLLIEIFVCRTGSELIIGGVDPSHMTGDFIFAPVHNASGNLWQFHAESYVTNFILVYVCMQVVAGKSV